MALTTHTCNQATVEADTTSEYTDPKKAAAAAKARAAAGKTLTGSTCPPPVTIKSMYPVAGPPTGCPP